VLALSNARCSASANRTAPRRCPWRRPIKVALPAYQTAPRRSVSMTCWGFVTWWSSYKALTFHRALDGTDIPRELERLHPSTQTGCVIE
jgi:hypothetical protein